VKRLLPPVRIHAWGGLGSQLFAIAMAEDFKTIFPKRSIKIVLHTGGVTRRMPEVTEIFPEFEYEYEDDFRQKGEKLVQNASTYKSFFRSTVKKILYTIGFMAQCDDDFATKRLFPWIVSIRGHYSYRTINSFFLIRLEERCRGIQDSNVTDLAETCIVHYRLGDLLVINEKSPVSALSLASEYLKIKDQIHFTNLIVFSDSPTEARLRFSSLISDKLLVLDSKTASVIANAIRAKYFIGTSSKISFWIAGIREVVYQSPSSLPLENFDQYIKTTRENSDLLRPYITNL
jgi:hypothetical protein